MKINGTNPSRNIQAYQNQNVTPPKAYTKQNKIAQASDKLEISQEALKMQHQHERKAYINEIKQQIEKGEYKPDAQQTAKGILNFFKQERAEIHDLLLPFHVDNHDLPNHT